jgi:rhodanese-related sulfurtransferase
MTLPRLTPAEARRLIEEGAVLIDIRGVDEFRHARIPGARNMPLDTLDRIEGAAPVIFHCRSGMRTQSNAARLAVAAGGPAFLLEGGLDAWRGAGLPIAEDRAASLPIMRQVQIASGALVLAGLGLGLTVTPAFLGLAAFIGAGQVFSGATGSCGMARVLETMPWNARSAAA